MLQPINTLREGCKVKVLGVPTLGILRIEHINDCGVRVSGTQEIDGVNRPLGDNHVISGMTPVEFIPESFKQGLKDLDEGRVTEVKGDLEIPEIIREELEKTNPITQESLDIIAEANRKLAADPEFHEIKQEVAEITATISLSPPDNTYVWLDGKFTAKEFAEYNNIDYPIALKYLKTFGKTAGTRSLGGRGKPSTLYTK